MTEFLYYSIQVNFQKKINNMTNIIVNIEKHMHFKEHYMIFQCFSLAVVSIQSVDLLSLPTHLVLKDQIQDLHPDTLEENQW